MRLDFRGSLKNNGHDMLALAMALIVNIHALRVWAVFSNYCHETLTLTATLTVNIPVIPTLRVLVCPQ